MSSHRVFDVLVVGAGHAGLEAACAAARMGADVALVSFKLDNIAALSCNPAVGGLAKGHLVREIDAMGGVIGRIADATGIHFRMLNASKGPAVQAPRVQCDRNKYPVEAARLLGEDYPGVTRIAAEVCGFLRDGERVVGVETATGPLRSRTVIVTTGTFLRAVMHTGPAITPGGRRGEATANSLSTAIAGLGLSMRRLKTGTPCRIDGRTLDYTALDQQPGDDPPQPLSFRTDFGHSPPTQTHCHLTRTTEATHRLIAESLHRAPLFTGQIGGVGPRYCPSIEDKVKKFPDRLSHHIFLEPEDPEHRVVYPNGISTSLPIDVQEKMLATIPGLAGATLLAYGYAVEYDMVPAHQVGRDLQVMTIPGLYLAGQILGTSGYEEAAAQGLIAGINAARQAGQADAEVFCPERDQAYIGVLIDDLVSIDPKEPYRLFTSRAEHRILLRADNADRRLTPIAAQLGLVDEQFAEAVRRKAARIDAALDILEQTYEPGNPGVTLSRAVRRPGGSLQPFLQQVPALAALQLTPEETRQVEIDCQYQGYLKRQQQHVERARKMESIPLARDLSYDAIPGLRNEARQALTTIRPERLGQASRIEGVTPADVAVLMVHLRKR